MRYYVNSAMDQIERAEVLKSYSPLFEVPTTGARFDNLLYFMANTSPRGRPFDSCLRLDQKSIRDLGQELGCHSWAARYSGQCSRAGCDRYGYVEFYED
jgi:hypothetical protein